MNTTDPAWRAADARSPEEKRLHGEQLMRDHQRCPQPMELDLNSASSPVEHVAALEAHATTCTNTTKCSSFTHNNNNNNNNDSNNV